MNNENVMNEDPRFRIKIYGVGELAMIYNPECTPATALSRFSAWIAKNRRLERELKRAGWRKGNRIFTPRQVGCIVEYLGWP